jgi:TRAP-type C4-dicarboxylate transport system permease small subunit
MKILRRIDDGIARLEGWVVVTFLIGIVIVGTFQTLLRNVFDAGFEWADEALRWATLWVAFLGASLATHRRKHIALDVATRLFPRKIRRVVETFTGLGAALVAATLAWGSYRFVREIGSTEPPVFGERVPRTPLEMIVPVTFAIMSLRFFLHVVFRIFDREEPPAGDVTLEGTP